MTHSAHTLLLMACSLWCSGCFLFEDYTTPPSTPDMGMMQDMQDALDMRTPVDMVSPLPDLADMPEALDLMQDASSQDEEMGEQVVTPPGWWDGRWTVRLPLMILQGWQEEIVLPIRIPGSLSQQSGHDLRFVLNAQSAPLLHEAEAWVEELDNVVWVRFPDGFDPTDTLHVYARPTTPIMESEFIDSGEVWRDLARHVYHFDGQSQIIETDSVTHDANHLLITPKSSGAGPTYTPPSEEMGKRIVFDGTLPTLTSQRSPSPLHVEPEQDTTVEIHLSIDDFVEDGGKYIADENGCVGSLTFYGTRSFGYRMKRGVDCNTDTPSTGGQTIVDFHPNDDTRVYPNTPYLLFNLIDWHSNKAPQIKLKSFSFSRSAITSNENESGSLYIDRYTASPEVSASTMEVGGWTFQSGAPLFKLDTLIIHEGLISADEMKLRWDATQHNAEVFGRGDLERIEDQ